LEQNMALQSKILEQSLKHQQDFQMKIQSEILMIHGNLKPLAPVPHKVEGIHSLVSAINTMFSTPKKIGAFGEFRLEMLIEQCMPHKKLYDFQYTLSNNKKVDCILHFPSPIGELAMDSKFPFDSFKELVNSEQDETTATKAKENFRDSLKGHIRDIKDKYIIPGETADYAIMFLPSEALFLKVAVDFHDIILHANQQRVYITSPTTLMVLLAQLRGTTHGLALQKETDAMVNCLRKMSPEVNRLVDQFEASKKSWEKSKTVFGNMEKTLDKFRLLQVNLENLKESASPPLDKANDSPSTIVVENGHIDLGKEATSDGAADGDVKPNT
jgi:DNA recombination protein RmuC